mmetsp:Transcript_98598/g.228556  ORF Transcript_98598/g.228556 Transcript_98598/m.228556 type:complete len:142 (-) Transcript_98598:53-478(-)
MPAPEKWLGQLPNESYAALGGYGQSKAVAERLLEHAAADGLQVRVLRCGDVAGHRSSGYFNTRDATMALVRACVQLGAAVTPSGYAMGWSPADGVAAALVWLAGLTCPSDGEVFHLSQSGPLLDEVLAALGRQGLSVEPFA